MKTILRYVALLGACFIVTTACKLGSDHSQVKHDVSAGTNKGKAADLGGPFRELGLQDFCVLDPEEMHARIDRQFQALIADLQETLQEQPQGLDHSIAGEVPEGLVFDRSAVDDLFEGSYFTVSPEFNASQVSYQGSVGGQWSNISMPIYFNYIFPQQSRENMTRWYRFDNRNHAENLFSIYRDEYAYMFQVSCLGKLVSTPLQDPLSVCRAINQHKAEEWEASFLQIVAGSCNAENEANASEGRRHCGEEKQGERICADEYWIANNQRSANNISVGGGFDPVNESITFSVQFPIGPGVPSAPNGEYLSCVSPRATASFRNYSWLMRRDLETLNKAYDCDRLLSTAPTIVDSENGSDAERVNAGDAAEENQL